MKFSSLLAMKINKRKLKQIDSIHLCINLSLIFYLETTLSIWNLKQFLLIQSYKFTFFDSYFFWSIFKYWFWKSYIVEWTTMFQFRLNKIVFIWNIFMIYQDKNIYGWDFLTLGWLARCDQYIMLSWKVSSVPRGELQGVF